MKAHTASLAFVLGSLATLVPTVRAEAPSPGSVLVYPIQDSRDGRLTLISVTNTRLDSGGAVRALFRYVNTEWDPWDPKNEPDCKTLYRAEHLTPADTVTVVSRCHNAPNPTQGYLVVSAQSATAGFASSHNHLIGSTVVISGVGQLYSLLPYSFEALTPEGTSTDLDFDGRLDFDGAEYEALPDSIYLDSVLTLASCKLALVSLASNRDSLVQTSFSIWNDDEFPLSLTLSFRCWYEERLDVLSPLFSSTYLNLSTPNDPNEVDADCDGDDDAESAWIKIDGVTASSAFDTQVNPPLLGALTSTSAAALDGGRILWGSTALAPGQF